MLEYDKVALGWNPSNSVQDPCFIAAKCTWGTESLFKLTNGKIENTYFEIFRFMQKFALRSFQANDILGKKHKLYLQRKQGLLNMSDTMIW